MGEATRHPLLPVVIKQEHPGGERQEREHRPSLAVVPRAIGDDPLEHEPARSKREPEAQLGHHKGDRGGEGAEVGGGLHGVLDFGSGH